VTATTLRERRVNQMPLSTSLFPTDSHNVHAFLIASGNWFFKVRDILSPVVFIALVLCTRPLWEFGDPRDTALITVGGIVGLSGQVLRAAVIGYAYVKRGGKDKKVYADTLVQEGFFNHCRNPLYVGNLLILIGLLIAYGSVAAFVIGTVFYLYLYLAITLAEENYLRAKFGTAYDEYVARVNRYLPDFRGLRTSLADMTYDWPRLIRKEYGTIFAWFGTLVGIIAWKASLDADTVWDRRIGIVITLLLVIGAGLWATARILKKRGVLGTG
jgi:protein-S-isoprenylcysteine O-methyltransferase Ste14